MLITALLIIKNMEITETFNNRGMVKIIMVVIEYPTTNNNDRCGC